MRVRRDGSGGRPAGQLTVGGEAAGSAAPERALLGGAPQQLRPSAPRRLQVDGEARHAPDPAVLVVGGGRATGRGAAAAHSRQHGRQEGRQPQGAAHVARL